MLLWAVAMPGTDADKAKAMAKISPVLLFRAINALPFDRRDDLFSTVFQVIGGDDIDVRVVDDGLAFFDVCAFQAHDQRHFQAHFLDRTYNALGDHIAAHDAAEDVDQNAFDLRGGGDDFERLSHLFLGRAAADIQEVRARGTV